MVLIDKKVHISVDFEPLDLRFGAFVSVFGSSGLRANTSRSRRTISLQPPFEGQHISIFIFLAAVVD